MSISWNARDQLGRIVEVTSDTVADVAPPGPEQISTGGEQRIRLLGPFRVSFDDEGMAVNGTPGVVVGDDLPYPSMVLAWPAMIQAFDGVAAGAYIQIDLMWEHGNGADTPGRLGEELSRGSATSAYGDDGTASGWPVIAADFNSANGMMGPVPYIVRSPGVQLLTRLRGTADGTTTQGIVDIYALIAEPA